MRVVLVLAVALCLAAPASQAEELSFNGPNAFRLPWEGLDTSELARFNYGRSLFHYHWDPLPSASGGERSLGPLFNADSCEACHIRDGRGLPPGAADGLGGLVLLLEEEGRARFGQQVQDRAVDPLSPELAVRTEWIATPAPGDPEGDASLRRPVFILSGRNDEIVDLNVAPRLAPPLIGLGLLADVPQAHLDVLADPDDRDGDGISGRVHPVRPGDGGEPLYGRFGWKAEIGSVAEQVAKAATLDMGLAVPEIGRPEGDCTAAQTECLAQAGRLLVPADFDMDENSFRLLAFYTANLAVPPRRIADAERVREGEQLFARIGCAACHVPEMPTGSGALIAPYTDLLLHDMGPGLADSFAVGDVDAGEWRTPPLWGIGRTEEVSGGAFFLHDGRARGLEEAILWHGGEAEETWFRYRNLSADERQALLSFLNSL